MRFAYRCVLTLSQRRLWVNFRRSWLVRDLQYRNYPCVVLYTWQINLCIPENSIDLGRLVRNEARLCCVKTFATRNFVKISTFEKVNTTILLCVKRDIYKVESSKQFSEPPSADKTPEHVSKQFLFLLQMANILKASVSSDVVGLGSKIRH